jgi:hypothetical protein
MPAGAVTLGAATSDRVDNGADAAMDNMDPFTACTILKLNTLTSQRVIWAKGAGNVKAIRLSGTAGDVQAVVLRAANGAYTTNNLPIVAGVWCFIAFSFNSANAAGSQFKIYSARQTAGVWGPVSVCTYSAAVDGSGALTSDAGSSSLWGNNSLALNAAQGDFAFGNVFASELSLADLQSWLNAPRQNVNNRVGLGFKAFGLYGADAIDFSTGANGTVTGGVQAAGPGIHTAIDDVQTLVTACVGNLWHLGDSRLNAKLSAWKDALGANNGRAAGLTFAQATGANQPTFANERLVFGGTKSMATGQDTRLAFDGAAALHGFIIAKATSGPVVSVAQDPTNTGLTPYAGVQVGGGGNWVGVIKPAAAGTAEFQPDTGVVANDGKIRIIWFGKGTRASSFEDEAWRVQLRGRQQCEHEQCSVATTVAGGLKAAIGQLGASLGTFEICAIGYLAADPAPYMAAVDTYGATFGNTSTAPEIDTATTNRWMEIGDSNYKGTQTSDQLTPAIGSGTKTIPYLCVNDVTNSRGKTLTQEGWDTADVHKYNLSHGSNNIDDVIAALPRTIGPNAGLYTGQGYVRVWCIGGSVLIKGLTLAQLKARWITLKAAVNGYGFKLITATCTDGGSLGTSTFGLYNAASPSLVKSAQGQIIFDFDAELRANTATYTDYLEDMDALAIVAPFNRACDNAVYFNPGDLIHLRDPATAIAGPFMRQQLNNIVWPASGSGSRRRQRIAARRRVA